MSASCILKDRTLPDLRHLAERIKQQGLTLGFQQIGITDTNLSEAGQHLKTWLANNYHGQMQYMARYGEQRADPAAIVPGTLRVIVTRMDYLPENPDFKSVYGHKNKANISRYAQNKDYHKLIRKRLQKLAAFIQDEMGLLTNLQFRPFVDSGPIMEKPLAQKAGLGWIGKNTLVLNPKAGSFFFLGTLLTNLPLPMDAPFTKMHCGSCHACIDICPTKAIVAPHVLDARRCISYLTIELKEAIPIEFRQAIGNRIFGCDDCQIICPWNKFAKASNEMAFAATRGFLNPNLTDLFLWTEEIFNQKTMGSPIKRIGYERWLRNIAVALGNADSTPEVIDALKSRADHPSTLVREHVAWALAEHGVNRPGCCKFY
jgi:epoxyqueuosine reductase